MLIREGHSGLSPYQFCDFIHAYPAPLRDWFTASDGHSSAVHTSLNQRQYR